MAPGVEPTFRYCSFLGCFISALRTREGLKEEASRKGTPDGTLARSDEASPMVALTERSPHAGHCPLQRDHVALHL